MLVQQVLHSMYSETCFLGAGEKYVSCTPLRLTQPGFHHGACGSGKRCAAFLTPLADDAHMSASPKTTSSRVSPVISDTRRPVWVARRRKAWSRRPNQLR